MSVASSVPPAKRVYPPNISVTAPPVIRVYPRDSPHSAGHSYTRRNTSHSAHTVIHDYPRDSPYSGSHSYPRLNTSHSVTGLPQNRIQPLSKSASFLTNASPPVQQVTNQLATLSISRQRLLPTSTLSTSQHVALPKNEHLKQQRHIITIFEHTLAASAKQQKKSPEQKNLKDQLGDLIKLLSKSPSNDERISWILSFSRYASHLEDILSQISPEDASIALNFIGYRAALMTGLTFLDRSVVEQLISDKAPLPIFYLVNEEIEKWPDIFRVVARNCTALSISTATKREVIKEFTTFADSIFKAYKSFIKKLPSMYEKLDEKKFQEKK